MQAARSTAPREVADEVRMQEKRAAQKTVREETALKTKIAKDKEQQEVVWMVRPPPLAACHQQPLSPVAPPSLNCPCINPAGRQTSSCFLAVKPTGSQKLPCSRPLPRWSEG